MKSKLRATKVRRTLRNVRVTRRGQWNMRLIKKERNTEINATLKEWGVNDARKKKKPKRPESY